MPRKKREELLPSGEDPNEWKPEEAKTIISSDDEELDEVFSDFPQDESCIELYRVNPQGGRPLFIEEMTPSQFSFSYIAKKYGGGRYQAKAKYRDGRKLRKSFEIEGKPILVERVELSKDPHAPVLPGGFVPPVTPEPIVIQAGSNIEQVLVSLVNKMMQTTQGSEMQMLEKMKMYKELFASGPTKEAPLDQALSMFTKGVELASMQGGGGDGSNFWMMAIKELRDPLMKIVETVQTAITPRQPMQINPAGRPAQAGGTIVPTPLSPAAPVEDPSMLGIMGMVKGVLPQLINGAAKNSDPGLYTDFLLDQLPASGYPQLKKFLEEPGCLDKLAFLEPAIRFQANWWEALRVQLIVALTEELGGGDSNVQPSTGPDAPAGHDSDGDSTA